MTWRSVRAASIERPRESPVNIGDFLDLVALVIVGQKQSVALFGQTADFLLDLLLIHSLPFPELL